MVDSKENYKFDLGIKGLKISKKENYVTALRNESERVKFRKGNNKMNERSKKNYFLSGFVLYLWSHLGILDIYKQRETKGKQQRTISFKFVLCLQPNL